MPESECVCKVYNHQSVNACAAANHGTPASPIFYALRRWTQLAACDVPSALRLLSSRKKRRIGSIQTQHSHCTMPGTAYAGIRPN